jgi:hypothetical protein
VAIGDEYWILAQIAHPVKKSPSNGDGSLSYLARLVEFMTTDGATKDRYAAA